MTRAGDDQRKPLRIGLIGAGNMARTHAEGWVAAGEDVVGIHAPQSRRAADLAGNFGAKAIEELDAFLESVDVVDICTPTNTHLDYIEAAATQIRHVVCEKPLALTAPQALQAAEACQRAGVWLLVGHVVRFFPEYVSARHLVQQGAVGQPAVVRLNRLSYQPGGDQEWFRDRSKSGGLVFDLMIHDFDYARWVCGEVTTVFAKSVRTGHPDAPDHVLAILQHESETISHVQGSWALPPPTFRTSFEIAGSDGLITFDSELQAPVRYLSSVTEVADVPAPKSLLAESPWTTELGHFAEVLAGKAEPQVRPEDAIAAVQIAEAAVRSIASGGPVTLQGASS